MRRDPTRPARPPSAPPSSTSGCAAASTDAVVAPGLALDAAGARPRRRRPAARCTSTTTSASAAFLALGLGLATGRPAVVLTTSGTAAVELHPAVVEADLAGVPLLVVHGRPAARAARRRRARRPSTRPTSSARPCAGSHDPGRARRRRLRPRGASLAARALRRGDRARAPVRCTSTCRSASRSSARPASCPPARPARRAVARRRGGRPVPAPPRRRPGRAASPAGAGVIVGRGGLGDADAVHALADGARLAGARRPRSRAAGCRRRRPWPPPTRSCATPAFARRPLPDVVAAPRRARRRRRCSASGWRRSGASGRSPVAATGAWIDPRRAPRPSWSRPSPTPSSRRGRWSRSRRRAARRRRLARPVGDADAAAAGGHRRAVLGAHDGRHRAGRRPRPSRRAARRARRSSSSSSMPIRDVEWYARPAPRRRGARQPGRQRHRRRACRPRSAWRSATVRPTALLIGDVAFLHDTQRPARRSPQRGIDLASWWSTTTAAASSRSCPQADRAGRATASSSSSARPTASTCPASPGLHGVGPVREALGRRASARPCAPRGRQGGVHLVPRPHRPAANVAVHDELHAATMPAIREALGLSG